MKNFIIFSDLHIRDYRRFNSESDPKFRLHQFNKLNDIISYEKSLSGDSFGGVIVAGDVFDTSKVVDKKEPLSPEVMNQLVDVFLLSNCDWYVIAGNHDMDARLINKDSRLTFLQTISNLHSKFHYLPDDILSIEGTKIHFKNYTEEDPAEWVKSADILVTHGTIKGLTPGFWDKNCPNTPDKYLNYKKVISGHIHVPGHMILGNTDFWSPGVVMQNNSSDNPDIGYLRLTINGEDSSIVRESSKKYEFLEFKSKEKKVKSEEVKITLDESKNSFTNITSKEQIYEKFKVIVEGLENFGDDYKEKLYGLMSDINVESHNSNLKFKINGISVKGFYSIKELEWLDFDTLNPLSLVLWNVNA